MRNIGESEPVAISITYLLGLTDVTKHLEHLGGVHLGGVHLEKMYFRLCRGLVKEVQVCDLVRPVVGERCDRHLSRLPFACCYYANRLGLLPHTHLGTEELTCLQTYHACDFMKQTTVLYISFDNMCYSSCLRR